jgi:hypothetical protein
MRGERRAPLPIGTKAQMGTIEMIACIQGERYYFFVDKRKPVAVSMMPADVVEGWFDESE